MIRVENVTKTFGTGSHALSDISLAIDKGEFVFLVGTSGSGKTTLMRLLIREMLPTQGSIMIGDWDLTKLPNNKVPHLRRRIGVVFQDLKLLRDRTILENVMLPLELTNMSSKEAKQKAADILSQTGISEHAYKFPVQLSGGELQRAAIARALVFNPDILLADEPTGNLDTTTSWEIVKLLQDINASGTTVVMATHNMDIVNSMLKRVIELEKGKLIRDDHRGNKAETEEQKAESEERRAESAEKKSESKEKKGEDKGQRVEVKKQEEQEDIKEELKTKSRETTAPKASEKPMVDEELKQLIDEKLKIMNALKKKEDKHE